MITGCAFCVLNIPCQCSVSTDKLFLPPRLATCSHERDEITKAYPVNLALLHSFFDADKYASISGDTTFLSHITVDLPPFKLFEHNFSQALVSDHKNHLSLKRMVQAAKQDSLAMRTLSESLLTGDVVLPSTWPDTNSLISLVSLGVSSFAILASLYMFVKLRRMIATLALLQRASQAAGAPTVPAFKYEVSSTLAPPEFIIDVPPQVWTVVLLILSACMFVMLVYNTWSISCRRSKSTNLYLELTNGASCITFPILSLPLCPSHWIINPPVTIDHIAITGYFLPRFSVYWPDFTVTSRLTGTTIHLSTSYLLTPSMAFKVRRMLRGPFCAYILQTHQGFYKVLNESGGKIPDYS